MSGLCVSQLPWRSPSSNAHKGHSPADEIGGRVDIAQIDDHGRAQGGLHTVEIEHAELEKEFKFANEVQIALLPKRRPKFEGYEFWDHYSPARFVGGDYFDYNPVTQPAGAWAISLGDVSGKGMPAALLMARFSSEVRLLLQTEPRIGYRLLSS